MPELPEVETTKNGIRHALEGQVIRQFRVYQPSLRWPVAPELNERLLDQTIGPLSRRAKYILMPVADGCLIWHLGMSGSLRLLPPDDDSPVRKHDHILIDLANGWQLRYHDPRRFGALLWQEGDQPHPCLQDLGPEPLSAAFDLPYLAAKLRGKKQGIKQLLMHNPLVVGIGNIYACESLFLAGVQPQRPAGSLQTAEIERLLASIKQVLAAAITQGGTTLRDFVGGDGQPGYFAQELFVYGRAQDACRRCQTPIRSMKQVGRTSFYCPNCQS